MCTFAGSVSSMPVENILYCLQMENPVSIASQQRGIIGRQRDQGS